MVILFSAIIVIAILACVALFSKDSYDSQEETEIVQNGQPDEHTVPAGHSHNENTVVDENEPKTDGRPRDSKGRFVKTK